MKIATWNVERLKHKKQLDLLLSECSAVSADILVLTETDQRLRPAYRYCYETPLLTAEFGELYNPTENRVSIFTNYPCIRQYETYDKNTAICVELKTEDGNLIVYGTIIGIHGNRRDDFLPNLKSQMEDIKRLSKLADGFCICGDFNCSFADNYYYTKDARRILLEAFEENDIQLLTAAQPECIDHIAVSKTFIGNSHIAVKEWNLDKALSDHKGISVYFDCIQTIGTR